METIYVVGHVYHKSSSIAGLAAEDSSATPSGTLPEPSMECDMVIMTSTSVVSTAREIQPRLPKGNSL